MKSEPKDFMKVFLDLKKSDLGRRHEIYRDQQKGRIMESLADPRMTPEERETLIAQADEKLQARERLQKWFEEHPDVFDAIFEDEDGDYEDGDYEEVQG